MSKSEYSLFSEYSFLNKSEYSFFSEYSFLSKSEYSIFSEYSFFEASTNGYLCFEKRYNHCLEVNQHGYSFCQGSNAMVHLLRQGSNMMVHCLSGFKRDASFVCVRVQTLRFNVRLLST